MEEPITIAKHVMNEAYEKGIHDISPKKIQKLLYLIYSEYANKHKQPLFQERFNVTREGFVLKSIEDYYKYLCKHDYIEAPGKYGLDDINQETRFIIDKVLDIYGHIPVYNLVDYIQGDGLWEYCMREGIVYYSYNRVGRI